MRPMSGRFLLDHPEYTGTIGTIVLDPPRSGISPKSLAEGHPPQGPPHCLCELQSQPPKPATWSL